jgi:hypothetical protein
MYYIQHCFICRHSDSTVSEDAGIVHRIGYIPSTLGYISSTLGYISSTIGYISSTLGYISSTLGYISSTIGYISSINYCVPQVVVPEDRGT